MKRTTKVITILLVSMLLSTYWLSLGSEVIAISQAISHTATIAQNTFTSQQATTNVQPTTLTEPVTRAELNIDEETQKLSTVLEKQEIEMKIVLDTSSPNYALYKNPTFSIEMPSDIEKVTLKDVKLVLEDELTIKSATVVAKNEKQVIEIALEGEQTKYFNDMTQVMENNNVIAKGANIVVKADITVRQLTPSKTEKIVLYYTNENTNLYENTVNTATTVTTQSQVSLTAQPNTQITQQGMTTANITIVSPKGLITATTVTIQNELDTEFTNLTNNTEQFCIPAYEEIKTVEVIGSIVNNYENDIDNITILGRIPAIENTLMDSTETLTNTFTTTLSSAIHVTGVDSSKITIYYSENGAATKDLQNSENAWKNDEVDLSQVKSYLIIVEPTVTFAQEEQMQFNYTLQIPENLSYNQTATHLYKVYYESQEQEATIYHTKTSGIIELTTGEGPELDVKLESSATTVREGQIIKMQVTVENTGKVTVENVKVNVPLPEYAHFMEYVSGNGFYQEKDEEKVIEIGTLEENQIATVDYYMKIMNNTIILPEYHEYTEEEIEAMTEDEQNAYLEEREAEMQQREAAMKFPKEMQCQVFISCDNVTGKIPSNYYSMAIQEGKIAIEISDDIGTMQTLKKGDTIYYMIKINNISQEEQLNDAVLTIPLADGVKYISGSVKERLSDEEGTAEGINFNEESNVITVSLGTIEMVKTVLLHVEIERSEGSIQMTAVAKANGTEEHYSNTLEYMVEKVKLEISELTVTPKYMKEGETVTYRFTITNSGQAIAQTIMVKDVLPEELIFEKATYTYGEGIETITRIKKGVLNLQINHLSPGESTQIVITAIAGPLASKTEKQIQNQITVSAEGVDSRQTNEVTNIIEYNETIRQNQEEDEPSTPTEKTTYKITGTAWLDSNQNGKREEKEELLPNIKVMLIYKANNQIVKDVDTQEQKIVSTNEQGQYEFNNLEPEEYLVIFLYDATNYNITEYQKEGVSQDLNSDVINLKIILDGEATYAGVANTIKITNSNVRDVDIGLYVAKKFDLRIDQYISKITLTTPTIGTRVNTYEKSQLEKVEILSQNVEKSNLIVEYKIVVTNEGQVPGYATKIIDYLPETAKFSTELNPTWYVADNNRTIYNASLAEVPLKPGESKEITLTLSLAINEKNIGTYIDNRVEIYESDNELGLEDIDSTEANMLENEDDISKTEIVLSVVTGKIMMYTTLIIVVITMLIMAIAIIKKKILD